MKALKKQCDGLWAEVVKARAGYKSELSGKPGRQIGGDAILNAHHMHGKPNYRLRYELRNGLCVTNGEHNFKIHHTGRAKAAEEEIKKVRGDDFEYCATLSKHPAKTDLKMVLIYLQNELKKLQNNRGER